MLKIYQRFKVIFFPSLEFYLRILLQPYKSFVDLGCGPASPVMHLKKNYQSLGVDAAKECIEESRLRGIHSQYLRANILHTGLKSKTFDAAISLDVINLLTKADGLKLIKEMERLASKRIIILTPNGKIEEPPEMKSQSRSKYKSAYKYLKYRSDWTADEMRQLGFKVIGINGLKSLRRSNAVPIITPTFFGALLSDLTQLIVQFFPSKAFHLLCYKDIK